MGNWNFSNCDKCLHKFFSIFLMKRLLRSLEGLDKPKTTKSALFVTIMTTYWDMISLVLQKMSEFKRGKNHLLVNGFSQVWIQTCIFAPSWLLYENNITYANSADLGLLFLPRYFCCKTSDLYGDTCLVVETSKESIIRFKTSIMNIKT